VLARSGVDAVARFVGDFQAADRAWAAGLGLCDRLELHPFMGRRRALAMMRDSEALLLLMPKRGAASRVIPAKLFDYLAAARPILASVPTESIAAELVSDSAAGIVVPPDDDDALIAALAELVSQWNAGRLQPVELGDDARQSLSRAARVRELAALLEEITSRPVA
jgi:glycosyltransferase involved in cell wall biosynthesis